MDLVLRVPRPSEEAAFLRAHRATSPSVPNFLHYYEEGMSFRRYLEVLAERERGENLLPDHVPSTFLFAFAGTSIVGRVSIRHALNPYLERFGGHIGYAVVPEYRRQGYATAILRQSLQIARQTLGLTRVLVTCDDDNIGSIKAIEKNGGVLESVVTGPGQSKPKRRYWIANAMDLIWPAAEYLTAYVRALKRGWSPDNLRPQTALDHLARIAEDPARFLSEQVDREAKGPPIALPDGSMVARLPGYSRWMWDGEFCGTIGFRWQPGTNELPPHCLGHVGYSVVPWKRRRGYATRALQLLLPQAKEEALSYIELTTDANNIASRRVIEANGGQLIERFYKPAAYGGAESLRFRILLAPPSA